MELAGLRHVYEQTGPCATVYLEGRSPGEDAGAQVRLRWRALRDRLESQGAPGEALATLDSALGEEEIGTEQADGRVLVATGERVVFDAGWDAAVGAGDDAVWQELPALGEYVREAARSVRMVVVVADQQSARVRQEVVAEQHEPREVAEERVTGSAREDTQKPRGQWLAHRRIQRRAEEAASQNAKDMVDRVRKIASGFRPHVLVLAGEVQARKGLYAELPADLREIVAETDRGGAGDEATEMALTDELLRIASETSERDAGKRAEQWQGALAHELAVQGAQQTAHAAEMGAVETLLFEHGAAAKRESFLLKVCASTHSSADLVPNGTGLDDGVGAILRYPLTA